MIRHFQILLAKFVGWLASAKFPQKPLRWAVRIYVKYYQISLDDFDFDENRFSCFDDFFTRKIKQNARALDDGIISPVDATVYAAGEIQNGQILQIKSSKIAVENLFDNAGISAKYFMSFYLSPADYHRVHAPVDLKVVGIKYIPGMFYSVRPKIAKKRKVFLKNERVVLDCETAEGSLYLAIVAAQNVGKIELKPLGGSCPREKKITVFNNPKQTEFKKGEELGVFHLGSSVVLLTGNTMLKTFENHVVKFGESISHK